MNYLNNQLKIDLWKNFLDFLKVFYNLLQGKKKYRNGETRTHDTLVPNQVP